MPIRLRLAILIAASASTFALAGFARAADCQPPGVFQMTDDRFYSPSTGLVEDTCTRLLNRIADASVATSISPLADAGSVLPPVEASASASAPVPALPPLIAAIQRARQMLRARIDADAGKKPRVVTSYDVWVDVTLAVWDPRTDAIRLVDVSKNGTKIRMGAEDPGMAINLTRNNGVNSTFAVDNGDKVVAAVRYPIFKDISVSKRKPRYELHDVVYAPYSSAIHQPELVSYGRQTLRGTIDAAFAAYRAAGVRSRAFPDRLMADTVDPDLVEAILLIEHLNAGALDGAGAQDALDSVYVTVGANQDDAFDYVRSSAGAFGIVQFIPGTYAMFAKRSDLGLIRDFETGMTDPLNAVKAEIAYLDATLAEMPLAVRDLYYVDNDRVKEYLAAGYNAGTGRVKKAIVRWGDTWSDPHAAEITAAAKTHGARSAAVNLMKKATLLPETIAYVKKMRQALRLLRPPPLPLA